MMGEVTDLYAFHANVTFPDFLDALRHNRLSDILSDQLIEFSWAEEYQSTQFSVFSETEKEPNRLSEQIERGGYPHSSIFQKQTELGWTFVNPDFQKFAVEEIHPEDEELEDRSEGDTDGEDAESADEVFEDGVFAAQHHGQDEGAGI